MLRTFCWGALVVLAMGLMGCGKEETPAPTSATPPASNPDTAGATKTAPTPPPATAPSAVTEAQLDTVTKAKQPYKVILIVKTLNNPFFKPMVAAFKQTAQELGVQGDVQAAAQETSFDQQVQLVQTAAAQGYKAICITPADSKALVPALKTAADKGVLIINVDNRLDPATVKAQGLDLGGYVGADNEAGGKLAGEAMLAALGGKGKTVIIEGIRGVDNAEARKRGYSAAVNGKLDVVDSQTANWSAEEAHKVAQNLLAAHRDVTGIFCANDQMALGAMKAISEAGKKGKVTVVGYDNIPEVQAALASGEMAATIEQHPDRMGKYSLKMAVGILDGTISKGGELLVTLETIKKK
ncbi:MAG TPA: substrate-binding domain-containing protein [Chthonomonadaceae bacterium]|nr:substrate-binding domain-containing protein [Chthonomonadaceae bacterium]